MILFVQPFGIGALGGGARILRAMLRDAPVPWHSVAVSSCPPPPVPFGTETHLQHRINLGRIERSRYTAIAKYIDRFASRRIEVCIESFVLGKSVRGIHVVPHAGYETDAVLNVCQNLKVPLHLSVHDDPDYTLANHPHKKYYLEKIKESWHLAETRFVISQEMGIELGRRWGKLPFVINTDGVGIPELPRAIAWPKRLHLYFAGLFHHAYVDNIIVLQHALLSLKESHPDLDVKIILRGGLLPEQGVIESQLIKMLPAGTEADVHNDMMAVDMLYFPLGFDREAESMNKYSLSTKMVSYLGSGVPILYHGPANSAAHALLTGHRAAFICNSRIPSDLKMVLGGISEGEGRDRVVNALDLASGLFNLSRIRREFWTRFSPICVRDRAK